MAKEAKKTPYHTTKLSVGYMVKCDLNPEISTYGKTKKEALSKIDAVIDEYTRLFPHKVISQ